ncbi:MAG: hypothetical protein HY606_10990 [Planctomycetes bacterium]|nr:hypothetical protein [Planctomycetota bacterium]
MRILLFISSALVALGSGQEEKGTKTNEKKKIAKFEPPDGKVYHGFGQNFGKGKYFEGLKNPGIFPLVENIFSSIPGTRSGSAQVISKKLEEIASEKRVPMLSIAFNSGKNPTDSEIARTDKYDELINEYATLIKQFSKPIFIRPGFEFNGSWNKYTPVDYVLAFRKLVDRFRAKKITNAAYLWCYEPNGPDDFGASVDGQMKWYPGDDYVDWFSLDVFYSSSFDPDSPDTGRGKITVKARSEKFLKMARKHAKPVFLAETSSSGVNITSDENDGKDDWESWFRKFFDWIASRPEIKGFIYFNNDWANTPWDRWGDCRIEINSYILKSYIKEMKKKRYIHQQDGLVK